MNPKLQEFLREAATVRFRPGRWDCAMMLANWVQEVRGADPAAHLRDAYRSEAEWQAIVAQAGGLVCLVGDLAAKAGLAPTDDPLPGDIGVVAMINGETGAIKVPRGWAAKGLHGLTSEPAEMLAAWRVEN